MTWRFRLSHGISASQRGIALPRQPKLYLTQNIQGAGGEGETTIQVLNWTQEHPVEIFPVVFAAENFPVPQAELKKEGWQLEPPVKRRLLERICSTGILLRDLAGSRVYRGITTGFNEAFIIDGVIRAKLLAEDAKSVEIIKPFLRGRNVSRWRINSKDLWLIFTRNSINIEQYPAILEYLKKFRDQLEPKPIGWDEKRNSTWKGRKTGNYKWYEIQDNIAYWQEFEKLKIISTKVSIEPTFALDKTGGFLSNTSYFFVVNSNPLYLLAFLNSNISAYYAKSIFVEKQNGWYEVQPDTLEKLPIPKADAQQIVLIEAIVTAILAPTTLTPSPSPACGRGEWERLINGFVYELFFPDDLHQVNIRLFDTAAKTGLDRLATLDGSALTDAAHEIAAVIFAPGHPLQGMLADLQKLEVVRIIEGKD